MRYYDDIQLLAGNLSLHPTEPIVLERRDYYCLQYNHAGRIRVRIDDRPPQDVSGPSLLITYPGGRFEFGAEPGASWHHNYVAFRGARIDRYLSSGFLPIARPLRQVSDPTGFLSAFEVCVRHTRAGRNAHAAHALEGVLLLVGGEHRTDERPEHRTLIRLRQLTERIRARPDALWSFGEEASRLHLSQAHFRRLFRQVTGTPPGQFVTQCRLSLAAERLVSTGDPIKSVAADAGFESVHYFTRLFRRRYHLPPGRFRQEFGSTSE